MLDISMSIQKERKNYSMFSINLKVIQAKTHWLWEYPLGQGVHLFIAGYIRKDHLFSFLGLKFLVKINTTGIKKRMSSLLKVLLVLDFLNTTAQFHTIALMNSSHSKWYMRCSHFTTNSQNIKIKSFTFQANNTLELLSQWWRNW